jgi:small-conductance mechanosensitive channel
MASAAQWKDTVVNFLTLYGFQILGALVILAVGWFIERWIGNLAGRWLGKQQLEPTVRLLLVRMVRLSVFGLAVILALDKFGVRITPFIAGIGLIGVCGRVVSIELFSTSLMRSDRSRAVKDPAPVIGINALKAFSINIAVQPWVKAPDFVAAQLEIYQAVVEQFCNRQIGIPFPQHEVRLLNAPAKS